MQFVEITIRQLTSSIANRYEGSPMRPKKFSRSVAPANQTVLGELDIYLSFRQKRLSSTQLAMPSVAKIGISRAQERYQSRDESRKDIYYDVVTRQPTACVATTRQTVGRRVARTVTGARSRCFGHALDNGLTPASPNGQASATPKLHDGANRSTYHQRSHLIERREPRRQTREHIRLPLSCK